MPSYINLKDEYLKLFASCEPSISVYKPVKQIMTNQSRYESVGLPLGIPWYFIGVIHMMESSCNFKTHLHNGDSLRTRTVHVPTGRPATGMPPFTWEDSAKDALVYEGFAGSQLWSLSMILYRFEKYNGWGYRNAKINIPSPYLWSMSNHYTSGKFLEEKDANGRYRGVFHPEAVSKQCGAVS